MNVYIFTFDVASSINVSIFSPLINNSKILLNRSHNIEPVLFFLNFFVTQVTSQPYMESGRDRMVAYIQSIRSRPLSGHASKGRFKTRQSRDGANTTLTTNFLPD